MNWVKQEKFETWPKLLNFPANSLNLRMHIRNLFMGNFCLNFRKLGSKGRRRVCYVRKYIRGWVSVPDDNTYHRFCTEVGSVETLLNAAKQTVKHLPATLVTIIGHKKLTVRICKIRKCILIVIILILNQTSLANYLLLSSKCRKNSTFDTF